MTNWTGLHDDDTPSKLAGNFSEYLQMIRFDTEYNRKLLQKAIEQNNKPAISAIIDLLELALPNWREEFGINYDDGRPKQLKLWDW